MCISKLKIAITGSIATGKSSAFNIIKNIFKENASYIDLDEITKNLYEDLEVKEFLVKNFGTNLKSEISKLVFSNKEKLNILSEFLHKKILFKMNKEIEKSNKKYIFIDFPLLYEINFQNKFDIDILIYTKKENQIKRLMKRDNINEEEALKKINSQMDIDKKKELSKYVVYNDEDEINLFINLIDTIFSSIRGR